MLFREMRVSVVGGRSVEEAEAMTEAPVGIVSDVVSFVEVVLVNTVAAQERRTSQFSPLSKESDEGG